ncbi:MAG TPA: protein phosphatase CheZ, partial [Rubrivivax sp.]|nr:protein phosphatase CheZ [Rubrivivax sp.]
SMARSKLPSGACGSAQDGKHEADDATRRAALGGPVIDPTGRTDVVSSQGEVDDLLASLGF